MTEYAEIRRIIDDITVSFTPIRSSVGKITYTLLNLSICKVGRPFNPHNSDVCTIDEPPICYDDHTNVGEYASKCPTNPPGEIAPNNVEGGIELANSDTCGRIARLARSRLDRRARIRADVLNTRVKSGGQYLQGTMKG